MDNYWLKRHIEIEGLNLEWNLDREEMLKTLIKETSHLVVDLERLTPNPSPFDEGEAVVQCIEGTYDREKAKSWVCMHLYGHAVRQATAIGILIEESCVQAGFQLWRSLFEAHVICDFLVSSCQNTPQVFQDYISHSLLRSGIRHKTKYNELCKKKEKEPHYKESDIDYMKCLFRCKFGSKARDYTWAKCKFGFEPTFSKILEYVDNDMEIFYNLSSKEIHPTLGHRSVITDLSLPLPTIPILPINDVFNVEEMYLDHLTAKSLVQMTSRVNDFLNLDESLRERLESLKELGKDVLDKLANEGAKR